jgi:hypothetical protein
MAVKEAVNRSYETTLREGLLYERRLFHAMFATEDQKEGMAAFLEKREAQFRDKLTHRGFPSARFWLMRRPVHAREARSGQNRPVPKPGVGLMRVR